jgi:PatG C-terminal
MSERESVEQPLGLSPAAAIPAVVAEEPAAAGNLAECPTCGGIGASSPPSYVYAIGKIEPRFPRLAVEKEFAQAGIQAETQGQTDRQHMHRTITRRENRYLVRQLCWVMTIQGLETYILVPRDPTEFDLLVEAFRPVPRATDTDVVIGTRGPVAPPTLCNGLMVPIVAFDQIYSFDVDAMIREIPRGETPVDQFEAVAGEVFNRVIQIADNAGAMDEHRALNYLVMRYPAVYATVAEAHARNASLSAVEVRPSALSGTRRIVEVVFSFTHRVHDVVEKFFTRVDVTEEFPFLVSKMSPYFDHR